MCVFKHSCEKESGSALFDFVSLPNRPILQVKLGNCMLTEWAIRNHVLSPLFSLGIVVIDINYHPLRKTTETTLQQLEVLGNLFDMSSLSPCFRVLKCLIGSEGETTLCFNGQQICLFPFIVKTSVTAATSLV